MTDRAVTPTELNVAMAQLGISRRELSEDTGLKLDRLSRMKHGKAEIPLLLQRYFELRLNIERLMQTIAKISHS